MSRRAKLRAIDQGTRYDVAGKLRGIVRQIESGEMEARDVILLTRECENNRIPTVTMHHFGNGTIENIHWMLSTAQRRIEPS